MPSKKEKIKLVVRPVDPTLIATPPKADILALQCMYNGTANAAQMQRGMGYIMQEICMTGAWGWQDDPSKKDVMLGRQIVGQAITAILKFPLSKLEEIEE